jgi:hypothetical protein
MRLQVTAVLVFLCGVLVVITPDTYRSWRLAREGERVIGSVVESTPDQHRLVRYSFAVHGQRFEGADNGCSMENGLVTVWFAKSDPRISVCDRRSSWRQGALFGLLVSTVGVPLVWLIVGIGKGKLGR